MFKKTLLATALSTLTFGAAAATLAITGVNVSQEGAVNDANIAVPNAVVTAAVEYTLNDTITFTISGADFDPATSVPAIATVNAVEAGDGTTWGLLTNTASTVTFRLTAQTDGGATPGVSYIGATFTLSGMQLVTSTVVDATDSSTMTYSALTNTNVALDTAGTLSDVATTTVAQFSSSVTKSANAVIDVNNARQQFTAGDDSTTTDVVTFTAVEAVAAVSDAAYTGATHVITGDFTWMDTDGTTGVSAGELAAAFACVGAGDDTFVSTIDTAMNNITAVATDAGANAVELHTCTFTNAGVGVGNNVLPVQTLTSSTTVAYNDATAVASSKETAAAGTATGSWTLNGSQVSIPYMPYGTSISQIIYAMNEGTQTGASQVDITLQDGTTSNCSLGNVAPGTTKLTGPVKTCVEASIGAGVSQKVALVITTNVPSGDIEVYSAYNVNTDGGNGNRVTVPNSSTHGLAATID